MAVKRIIIQIVLALLIGFLAYAIYISISGPVQWRNEKEKRYNAIQQKLIDIRAAQATYKAETGHYAATFPELVHFLDKGKIHRTRTLTLKAGGMKKTVNDVVYVPAADSLFGKGYDYLQIAKVPFEVEQKFLMKVKKDESGIEFLEVTDPDPFDPDDPLSFGSLIEPTLRASWETTN